MLLAYALVAALGAALGVALVEPPDRYEAPSASADDGLRVARRLARPASDSEGRSRTDVAAPRGVSLTSEKAGLYRGHTSSYWAARYRRRTRQYQQARRMLHERWQPTVDYALRLASAVFGVSYWEMRAVSWCESRHYPFARNGRYLGLFQLSWQPFGFSPFDPVASALSAAATVRRDGSWRQWECSP